jgi:ribosomal protein L29
MKRTDWKTKTESELITLLSDLRAKLRALRFDASLGKVQDTSSLRKTRSEIARVLFLLSSRFHHML